ncbi:MAG: rRNA maturation RNase YbeY [bacterium]
MKILINNWQKSARLRIKELKKVISTVLKGLGSEEAIVGITFVDDKTIKELNKKYRKKDRPTDVLSFYFDKEEACGAAGTRLLGDVVISVETALRQAKEIGHSFEKELKILLIHGILHLFDYDHIKKKDFEIMRKKEKEVFALIKNI